MPTHSRLRLWDRARRLGLRVLLVLGLATTWPAMASTNQFVVPAFRGQPSSELGFWERFTVPFGAPGNPPDQPGSNSGATLTQELSPSAFATGSGNLYDPSAAMAFTLTDETPFQIGTVVLQVRTLGSELTYDQVRLSYLEGGISQTLEPVLSQELDRGTILGASVSYLWQWDLEGRGVTSYSVAFATPDSSLSLDAITVDTWNQYQAVPEPSTALLFASGAALLVRARHRRR